MMTGKEDSAERLRMMLNEEDVAEELHGTSEEKARGIREAQKKALRLLERMDRTEKELREKLAQADFTPEAVDAAIAYVASFGYLNDERYAANYIRRSLSSKSRTQVMQELARRGIPHAMAEEAWETETADEAYDEQDLIHSLIRKKLSSAPVPSDDPAAMRRLYAYLARRGFSYEQIRRAVDDFDEME
ncbi:MAG: regulatory protein RecX [Blautia sp.]|nr:regulatory protein RecX [Blautia sp.]